MGMRRLLIDTNIYSYALRGDDVVVEVLRKAEEIGFSVISIGELLSGFKGVKIHPNFMLKSLIIYGGSEDLFPQMTSGLLRWHFRMV